MSLEKEIREQREQAARVHRGRRLMEYHRQLALQLSHPIKNLKADKK